MSQHFGNSEIQRVCRENLEKERAEVERKERERRAEVIRLQKDNQEAGGLWTSPEEVDAALVQLTTGKRSDNKAKLEAIKLQIRFRHKVISQTFSDKMGNFSAAGKAFSLEEMMQRIRAIVTQI